MKKSRIISLILLSFFVLSSNSSAAIPIDLGDASSFAILAGTNVANTGPSNINGSVGVSPGSAIDGFPPGIVSGGTLHVNDLAAMQAQLDLAAAYTSVADQPCDSDLSTQDLGGQTLTPKVYCFSSSAQLTGPLTLNAQGDPDALFFFQIASTLTTASDSSVLLSESAQAGNVFWQVGSSATLGTGTSFLGNILALTSITLNTGANINCGRALARNGFVTLDTNDVSIGCETNGGNGSGGGSGSGGTNAVPEPQTSLMLGIAFILILILSEYARRLRKAE